MQLGLMEAVKMNPDDYEKDFDASVTFLTKYM